MNLSKSEISKFLGLYKKEFHLIDTAIYDEGVLTAALKHYRYSYTVDDLDYYTATQLNLYLSQLTYILIGKAIQDESFNALPSNLITEYYEKMYSGRLFFVEINYKMRKMILKKNKNVQALVKIQKIKKIKESLFAKLSFDLDSGSTIGNLLIGMEMNYND